MGPKDCVLSWALHAPGLPTQLRLPLGRPREPRAGGGWLEGDVLPCAWQSCTPAGSLGWPVQLRPFYPPPRGPSFPTRLGFSCAGWAGCGEDPAPAGAFAPGNPPFAASAHSWRVQ